MGKPLTEKVKSVFFFTTNSQDDDDDNDDCIGENFDDDENDDGDDDDRARCLSHASKFTFSFKTSLQNVSDLSGSGSTDHKIL